MILKNFIVFEGIDGAGTSTQLNILKEKLENKNVYFTVEPTDLPTGKFLRTILSGNVKVAPSTAAFLFASDRNEHLYGKDGILEQTQKGNICICDRYIFSSLAYQSNECGMELPKKLNEDFPLPEYLFYFSINPEQSLKRITGRGVTEIYEKQDFLEKTKNQYDRIIADFKENSDIKIIEIDATSPIEEIEKIIWNVIEKLPIV